MTHDLPFIVVEDRHNNTLALCRESASLAGERLLMLSSTDAGAGYARFCNAYVHLSSNTAEFERICFRRYFLLAQYLHANPSCREFVLIDSDVLLFEGVGAHIGQLVGKADFSGSWMRPESGWDPCQISPHVSYWTSSGLLRFVAFVQDTYATPAGRRKLRAIAARFATRGVRGGISDMTLLHLWAHASGNTDPINRAFEGRMIDHNINGGRNLEGGEYLVRGGAKQLSYCGNLPFVTTPAGEKVDVMALHFQGSAKKAMSHALYGRPRAVAAVTWALLMARIAKNSTFRLGNRARRAFDGGRLAPAVK